MTVALGWIALGIAIAIGAFRMDRLARMNIEPWSAPKLVPGLVGVLIAVFTTLTVRMQPTEAILVLVCVYVGAIYGGSRTSILLNIPGTAANAAACLDGNALARQGTAGRAMGIATTGSVAGSLFGVLCLAAFTPMLAEFALKFGAFEFFWLGMLGVLMSGTLTGSDPVKGWLMGLLGLFVGILPDVSEDMAAWSSYAAARRASKERELFGKGSVEGLMATETGDNAAVPGAMIPALALALALGVPGLAPAAVLMAAMIIHGVQPGPMLMTTQPQFVFDVVAITLIATLAILVFGLVMVRPILWVLRVPREVIMPIVFVLCVLGSYSIASRLFDVYVMLVIGVICFFHRRRGYPVSPFVLGLVLGDIVDKTLRRGWPRASRCATRCSRR
jgi:TctA family transporter